MLWRYFYLPEGELLLAKHCARIWGDNRVRPRLCHQELNIYPGERQRNSSSLLTDGVGPQNKT